MLAVYFGKTIGTFIAIFYARHKTFSLALLFSLPPCSKVLSPMIPSASDWQLYINLLFL